MSTFPLTARGDADLTGFVSAFAGATSALSSFAAAAGGAATAGATLAVAGLIPAVDSAKDFEAEMVRLITLVGIGEDQMGSFEESILSLAPSLGAAPQDMARALFAITSGGERSAAAIDLLTASAKAARIGMGDMATIGRVGTAALQAFAKQGLTAEKALDVMVATVREGNLVAEELAAAFGRVIGIAAQMGVSFADVGAFIATFTRLGVNAEIAATSLRSALFAILSPGDKARKAFQEVGVSVEDLRKSIQEDGLTAAFIELLRAAGDNVDAIGDFIPNVRALSGVLGTAGAQAEQYVGITERVHGSTGILEDGFQRVQQTTENAFAVLGANIKTFSVTIGNIFLPPVNVMIQKLDEAVTVVSTLGIEVLETSKAIAEATAESALGTGIPTVVERLEGDLERLQQLSTTQLERHKEDLIQNIEEIREAQSRITAETSQGLVLETQRRMAAAQEQLEIVREILGARDEQKPVDLGNLVSVAIGPIDQQRKELDSLTRSLEENIMKLQGRERAILEATLAELDALPVERRRILALFDTAEALERIIELRSENTQLVEEDQRAFERLLARRQRQFASNDAETFFRRQEEATERARLAVQLYVESVADDLDRQQRLAENVSDAMVDSFDRMIRGTENVSEAFSNMVSRILAEVARLKLEETILKPLLAALVPIPDAPGALPPPTHTPTGPLPNTTDPFMGRSLLPSLDFALRASQGAGNRQTVVVEQVHEWNLNMIDERSGREFLRSHSGDIAEITMKAAHRGVHVGRRMRGM